MAANQRILRLPCISELHTKRTMHDQSHIFTHHEAPIARHAGVKEDKNKSSAKRNQRAGSRERADKQRAKAESREEGAERGPFQITWCRISGDLQVGSGNWTDFNTIERPLASTRATTAAVNASWALGPGSMTGGQAHAMSTVNR